MKRYVVKKPLEQINEEESLFPYPTRCLIVGSSGSGKTWLLYNIITNYWIRYKRLVIFTKSLEQPIYQSLRKIFEKVKKIDIDFYENCEEMTTVDECEPDTLIVFDDCLLEKQDIIREYFVRGRHKKISCIYLSQCYSKVDVQVIRNNVNVLITFEQNNHYMEKIYDDFVGTDMTFDVFKDVCREAWNVDHGFLIIDKTKKNGRYKFKDNDSEVKIWAKPS